MVDIHTETKMAAPMLEENAVFAATSRRLILNQFFNVFEQNVFWMMLQAFLMVGHHMFAQGASTN